MGRKVLALQHFGDFATMHDFERIILHCILYYNNQRIIQDFPFTREMIAENIAPHSSDIWNWSKTQSGANLIPVNYDELVLTLLPRTTGKFSRKGLTVNRLRYKHDDFTEQYLHGGSATIAYNPDDVSCVENQLFLRSFLPYEDKNRIIIV